MEHNTAIQIHGHCDCKCHTTNLRGNSCDCGWLKSFPRAARTTLRATRAYNTYRKASRVNVRLVNVTNRIYVDPRQVGHD